MHRREGTALRPLPVAPAITALCQRPDSVVSEQMQSYQKSHLFKTVIAFLGIILLLYGKALFSSDVLSQADLLLTFPPWKNFQPKDFERPRNDLLADQSFQVIPYLYYLKHAASEGRVPLWNPHIMGGMPFLANMQSAVFFPVYWLVLWMPVESALEWIGVIKIFLAGLGFYLFCLRALAVTPLSAFAGAVVYSLCGFNTVWLLYANSNVSLVAGWLLLSIHEVIHRGTAKSLFFLASIVALAIAGGHPETVLHLVVIGVLFAAFALWHSRAKIGSVTWKLGLAAILGAALSGVVLLPFIENGLASATLAVRQSVEHPKLPWFSAVTALVPNFFGNPAEGFYRGPNNYNEIACFASVSSLVLAGLAVAFARRNVGTYFAITVLAVCGMVAYGITPLFQMFHALPLYRYSLNTRLILGLSLALAALTAIGLDCVLRIGEARVWKRVRQYTTGAAIALLLLLSPFIAAHLVILSGNKQQLEYVSAQVIWFFLTVVALVGLLTWLGSHPERGSWIRVLWVMLICAEMIRFSAGYNPTIPRAHYAYQYLPSSIRFLQSRGLDRHVGVNYGELACNSSMVYGTYDFRGYDFPETAAYHRYFYELIDSSSRLNITHSVSQWTPAAVQALGNAGVRYFAHDSEIQFPGLRLVHSSDMKIYEYERAVPRAYLPRKVVEVSTVEDALSRMKAPGFDAAMETFITSDAALGSVPSRPPQDADVKIVSYLPESVRLEVRSSAPAVVVLNDTACEGWQAYINGSSRKIYIANGMFRAVAVPAGRSLIEFKYQPRGYALGKLLSLAALAVISLGWIVAVISAKR
ncbi:MAG: YfhO family protein [Acidobacteria bacterium]|nr:YfhO family protein [Acidobacteriota bacterium]